MTYELILGDPSYSSWSLRGWLLFERFGIATETHWVDFSHGSVADQLAAVAPAKTVPTLKTPDGGVVWDSLAIAEELANRHPDAGHWPADPASRALARSLAAEMHAGFFALRNDCPMNLRIAYDDVPVTDEIAAELRRLEQIWSHARKTCGSDGPWLCGRYSVADAFFAPIAARIAGYGLPVDAVAREYVAAHIADPAFRRWRAMGLAKGGILPWYDKPYPQRPWPGPAPIAARAVEGLASDNAACPFSGKPVTHTAEMEGHVIGFCNPFCRDKAVADPLAWPAVARLLEMGT